MRFLCGAMSMCFVNVHLPSGSGKEDDRNEHLHEILSYAFQGISRNGSSRQPKMLGAGGCHVVAGNGLEVEKGTSSNVIAFLLHRPQIDSIRKSFPPFFYF